jgi:hypothetical protein
MLTDGEGGAVHEQARKLGIQRVSGKHHDRLELGVSRKKAARVWGRGRWSFIERNRSQFGPGDRQDNAGRVVDEQRRRVGEQRAVILCFNRQRDDHRRCERFLDRAGQRLVL